jgi:hypothetical protein
MELTVAHNKEAFSHLFEVRMQPMWAMKEKHESNPYTTTG